MYWRQSNDFKDDEVERRPEWFDSKSLSVDTNLLKQKKERNLKLRKNRSSDCLVAMLASEVDFAQMFFSPTATGMAPWRKGKAHWRIYPSQLGFYTDDIVIGYTGRGCGKTTSMKQMIAQRMIFYNHSNAILTSHDIDHVSPRMNEIFQTIDEHPLFSLFVNTGEGSRQRRHPQYQRMLNGFQMYGISGGKTEAASSKLESPHVNILFGDEFQEYTTYAWRKMQNSINDYKENRKYGACFKVYGVNSQGRVDTVFYDLAHKAQPYSKHTYRVASWSVPRYTLDAHERNIASLGYSITASEFKQQVRGLTGERTTGVFSDDDYILATDLFDKLSIGEARYRFLRVNRKFWDTNAGNVTNMFARWFKEPNNAIQCVFSADYGTSAPSELGIWYEFQHPTEPDTVWALMARVEIIGLDGAEQSEIFDYLMDCYSPSRFSIDSTGATNTVYTILTDPNDDRYNAKNYKRRIYPARMNMDVEVGYSDEKPESGLRSRRSEIDGHQLWAIVENANVFSTNEISRLMHESRLAIPHDESIRREFTSLIAKVSPTGQIRYLGNSEHVISMFRCLSLLLHEDETLNGEKGRRREALGLFSAEIPVGQYFTMSLGEESSSLSSFLINPNF